VSANECDVPRFQARERFQDLAGERPNILEAVRFCSHDEDSKGQVTDTVLGREILVDGDERVEPPLFNTFQQLAVLDPTKSGLGDGQDIMTHKVVSECARQAFV
jgi:hypothetical protein